MRPTVIITNRGMGDADDHLFTMREVQLEFRREKHRGNKNMLAAVLDEESGLYRVFERKPVKMEGSNSSFGTSSSSS
mgnify:FL=1